MKVFWMQCSQAFWCQPLKFKSADELLQMNQRPALHAYGETIFDPQVNNSIRLWPFNFGTAGFFAARIRKVAAVEQKRKPSPDRPLALAGWFEAESSTRKKCLDWIFQIYGIDLDQILVSNNLQIWQFKNNLHLFPESFLEHFSNFPVQSLGMPLCEILTDEFVLSHEFVTRFGQLATKNVFYLEEDTLWSWMRGEDGCFNRTTRNECSNVIIKDHLQRVLGIGKIDE